MNAADSAIRMRLTVAFAVPFVSGLYLFQPVLCSAEGDKRPAGSRSAETVVSSEPDHQDPIVDPGGFHFSKFRISL